MSLSTTTFRKILTLTHHHSHGDNARLNIHSCAASYHRNKLWVLPYFLNNRFTDGGVVVLPYAPAALYPQENSWYSFLLEAESTRGSQCGWKD
jgi:hypothetical protein